AAILLERPNRSRLPHLPDLSQLLDRQRRRSGYAVVARARAYALRRAHSRRGRQSPHGAIGRHQHLGAVHDGLRAGQRTCRPRRRDRRRDPGDRSGLRARASRLLPYRCRGRRPWHDSRAVRRRHAARHFRYGVQVSAARVRRILHLCPHHGGSAVETARTLRTGVTPAQRGGAVDAFARRHRFRALEALPWLLAMGAYTAGYLAAHGVGSPLVGLVAASAMGAAIGALSGVIILRTQGLSILMLTLVVCVMLQEAANKMTSITGGADGLQGMQVGSVLGLFSFDIYGHTAYWYCLCVLAAGWLIARALVHAPFGRSLTGI